MKAYTFIGIVHPASTPLTLEKFTQVLGSIDTKENIGEIRVKVTDSKFNANLILYNDKYNTIGFELLPTLVFSVETMFQTYINTASYYYGKEYNLELTHIIDESGYVTNIRHVAGVVEGNHSKRPFKIEKVLSLLYKSPHSHRILGELNAAIGDVRDTGFHCYRAIEGIRQHFVTSGNKAASWNKLKDALNFENSYIADIENYADHGRHGEIKSFPPEKRDEFLSKTWEIMDRFLIYLESEVDKLDKKKFPKLV